MPAARDSDDRLRGLRTGSRGAGGALASRSGEKALEFEVRDLTAGTSLSCGARQIPSDPKRHHAGGRWADAGAALATHALWFETTHRSIRAFQEISVAQSEVARHIPELQTKSRAVAHLIVRALRAAARFDEAAVNLASASEVDPSPEMATALAQAIL